MDGLLTVIGPQQLSEGRNDVVLVNGKGVEANGVVTITHRKGFALYEISVADAENGKTKAPKLPQGRVIPVKAELKDAIEHARLLHPKLKLSYLARDARMGMETVKRFFDGSYEEFGEEAQDRLIMALRALDG